MLWPTNGPAGRRRQTLRPPREPAASRGPGLCRGFFVLSPRGRNPQSSELRSRLRSQEVADQALKSDCCPERRALGLLFVWRTAGKARRIVRNHCERRPHGLGAKLTRGPRLGRSFAGRSGNPHVDGFLHTHPGSSAGGFKPLPQLGVVGVGKTKGLTILGGGQGVDPAKIDVVADHCDIAWVEALPERSACASQKNAPGAEEREGFEGAFHPIRAAVPAALQISDAHAFLNPDGKPAAVFWHVRLWKAGQGRIGEHEGILQTLAKRAQPSPEQHGEIDWLADTAPPQELGCRYARGHA